MPETAPKESRTLSRRTTTPRFTDDELSVIREAAQIEDRAVSNLIRVATLQYARDVVAANR